LIGIFCINKSGWQIPRSKWSMSDCSLIYWSTDGWPVYQEAS
jgi:hypothetical protein